MIKKISPKVPSTFSCLFFCLNEIGYLVKLVEMESKGNKRQLKSLDQSSSRGPSIVEGRSSKRHDSKKESKGKTVDLDQILLDHLSAPIKKEKTLNVGDLQKVEKAVDSLGKSLRTIIDLTPDVYTHKDPKIHALLNSPRIRLAQYLTSISNLGVLEKTEKLITFYEGVRSGRHEDPSSILPLKAFKDDLASQFHGPDEISKQKAGARKREEISLAKKEVINKSNKVSSWPPALPEITNENLRRQVFTHKSVAGMHFYLTDVELLDVHNERLEFLGDSIINSLIAVITYDRFPYMHEGDLSNIRTALITNNTLSEWAKIYGMDKMLKFYEPKESKKTVVGGRGSAASTPKYIADVFEAYVGGLWVLHGGSSESVSIVRPWLEELASPMLTSIEQAQEGSVPLNYEAKKALYTKIGSASMSPTYVTTKVINNGAVYVECRMGDEVLALGIARTAKEAGLRAAMKALQSKEVIDKYAQLRRDIPRVLAPEAGQEIAEPHITTSQTGSVNTPESQLESQSLNESYSAKLQLDFIKDQEAAFAINPKKYFASLVGKKMVKYETKQLDNENETEVFESTLYLDGIKLKTATGHSAKSAEKRAAYFSLSSDYSKIMEWKNRSSK